MFHLYIIQNILIKSNSIKSISWTDCNIYSNIPSISSINAVNGGSYSKQSPLNINLTWKYGLNELKSALF